MRAAVIKNPTPSTKAIARRDVRAMELESLTNLAEFERAAASAMSPQMFSYTQKCAGAGTTFANNLAAYKQFAIQPRVLCGIDSACTETTILGEKVQTPIMLAPTPWHRLFHEAAEAGVSIAAKNLGSINIISSFSGSTFSEILRGGGGETLRHCWYQLLLHKDFEVMRDAMRHGEAAGCSAIVLTVDAPNGCRMCKSEQPSRVQKLGLSPKHLPLLPKSVADNALPTLDAYYTQCLDSGRTTWKYIERLRDATNLPIVLKGILRNEDVARAHDVGASGVIVSNHGGRQLDGAVGTLQALDLIKATRDSKIEIYLDGGIRTGADAFKALALGAKAVFVGRPVLYGLSVAGTSGVEKVLSILTEELRQTMLLSGAKTLDQVTRKLLVKC